MQHRRVAAYLTWVWFIIATILIIAQPESRTGFVALINANIWYAAHWLHRSRTIDQPDTIERLQEAFAKFIREVDSVSGKVSRKHITEARTALTETFNNDRHNHQQR